MRSGARDGSLLPAVGRLEVAVAKLAVEVEVHVVGPSHGLRQCKGIPYSGSIAVD